MFFDALSSSVAEYTSQSFFSTASTVFSEASSRPSSPKGEPSTSTQGNVGSAAAEVLPPSVSCRPLSFAGHNFEGSLLAFSDFISLLLCRDQQL
jgi:hypothetical protein